jgi:acyl-CoA thioester hydrolase
VERTAVYRVIYGDTDQMGVVYHGNYLRLFEIGRAEWIRSRGRPYGRFEREGYFLPVVEAGLRYRLPARYDDEVAIHAAISDVRGASLRFTYALRRLADEALLVEGHTLHACVGPDGKVRPLPDELRALLQTPLLQPPLNE